MSFETYSSLEFGLEMINEALLISFRTRICKPLLIKRNPQWIHRKITAFHRGSGYYEISVVGLATIYTRKSRHSVYVTATARNQRNRGWNFPISVTGHYTDDDPRINLNAREYSMDKKNFPKNW